MGITSPTKRKIAINQKRRRRLKLARLRKLYQATSSPAERDRLWQKVSKLAPWLIKDEFIKSIKK